MKKKPSFITSFRDPNLSDRELNLLLMYQIIGLKADVRRLTELVLQGSAPEIAKKSEAFFLLSNKQAFEEYEDLVHQFVTRKQNLPGN